MGSRSKGSCQWHNAQKKALAQVSALRRLLDERGIEHEDMADITSFSPREGTRVFCGISVKQEGRLILSVDQYHLASTAEEALELCGLGDLP